MRDTGEISTILAGVFLRSCKVTCRCAAQIDTTQTNASGGLSPCSLSIPQQFVLQPHSQKLGSCKAACCCGRLKIQGRRGRKEIDMKDELTNIEISFKEGNEIEKRLDFESECRAMIDQIAYNACMKLMKLNSENDMTLGNDDYESQLEYEEAYDEYLMLSAFMTKAFGYAILFK